LILVEPRDYGDETGLDRDEFTIDAAIDAFDQPPPDRSDR
jgi:hypothetical protein